MRTRERWSAGLRGNAGMRPNGSTGVCRARRQSRRPRPRRTNRRPPYRLPYPAASWSQVLLFLLPPPLLLLLSWGACMLGRCAGVGEGVLLPVAPSGKIKESAEGANCHTLEKQRACCRRLCGAVQSAYSA
jgi:hypothetical protein